MVDSDNRTALNILSGDQLNLFRWLGELIFEKNWSPSQTKPKIWAGQGSSRRGIFLFAFESFQKELIGLRMHHKNTFYSADWWIEVLEQNWTTQTIYKNSFDQESWWKKIWFIVESEHEDRFQGSRGCDPSQTRERIVVSRWIGVIQSWR